MNYYYENIDSIVQTNRKQTHARPMGIWFISLQFTPTLMHIKVTKMTKLFSYLFVFGFLMIFQLRLVTKRIKYTDSNSAQMILCVFQQLQYDYNFTRNNMDEKSDE